MAVPIEHLLDIMARLRDRDRGCPWDIEQTFRTIAPYTIEEAYEVQDAIERDDFDGLRDELGDLLLQVVYHARMAEEDGRFAFADVVAAICHKMIRRHPHVFGGVEVFSADQQTHHWEALKAEERREAAAAAGAHRPSALDGVTRTLPPVSRAVKLQKRAARVGFDWPEPAAVLDKLEEEAGELRTELAAGASHARLLDEVGDLLFVLVNLARKLDVDPDSALRHANAKFERRFRAIEEALAAEGRTPEDASLEEMEAHWQTAKADEVPAGPST